MIARSTGRGVLLLFVLATVALAQTEPWEPLLFTSGGIDYRLTVRCLPSGESFLVLSDGKSETVLGAAGCENLFPVFEPAPNGFHILWVFYQDGHAGLGLYNSVSGSSLVICLPGLKFAGSPVLVQQYGQPVGLAFLGNGSDNDDIFFFDLRSHHLTNITRTPWSEKEFSAETGPGGTLIRAVTLRDRSLYLLRPGESSFRRLGRRMPEGLERRQENRSSDEPDCQPANTFVAFGDSITWGKMRMFNLEGEYHPELAYAEKMKETLATFYGASYPINLGVPGDTTYDGALRVGQDLADLKALYFVLMLGTNDCISGRFSVDSSRENLAYIVDTTAQKDMRIIISTIPPRKDALGDRPYVRRNIQDLNLAIAGLAEEKGVGFIDTYGTFMATDPPDGWKALLEDIGGNHPSPAGHIVIAGLFAGVLAAFPPRVPTGVRNASPDDPSSRRFQWDRGCESDILNFRVEFGPYPDALKNVTVTAANWIDLPGFPSKDAFFRLQAVDTGGNLSGFTRIYSTAEKPRGKHRLPHPQSNDRPPG
jgi:lysophospholipase L1-like esterase